jgi:hypothetical protein
VTELEQHIDALARELAMKEHRSLWQIFNPKHMKLHMAKQILAYATPRLAAEIPDREPTVPATKLFNGTLKVMKELAPQFWHEDGNFPNMIELMRKLVIFIAEDDPYYRGWLEMFLLLLAQTTLEQRGTMAVQT